MKFKTLFSIILLSLGVSAMADLAIVSKAYEIKLSNFLAPATANGGVTFKECLRCAQKSVRVTPATRYAVNGKDVLLDDFKKAVAQANDREHSPVTVLHHLESDTILLLDVYTE